MLSVVNNLPFRKAAHFQRKGAKGVNRGAKETKSLLFMFDKTKSGYLFRSSKALENVKQEKQTTLLTPVRFALSRRRERRVRNER